jgi:hypothetical protein
MKHYRLLGITLLFATLSASAEAATTREIITAAQVATAIRRAGLNVSAEQVALPSDVVAKTDAPALKVESVSAWQGDLASVRLDCVVSDECLPFVVIVRRNPKDVAEGLFTAAKEQASRRPPVEGLGSKVVVRIGSPAVLLLDGGHVHIQLAVICLENGVMGQTIRVAGRAHQQTYLAEVCSDGLLRGRL